MMQRLVTESISRGQTPPPTLCASALWLLADLGRPTDVEHLLDDFAANSIEISNLLYNCLLYAYAKAGRASDAARLFRKMATDVAVGVTRQSWNYLCRAKTTAKDVAGAITVLERAFVAQKAPAAQTVLTACVCLDMMQRSPFVPTVGQFCSVMIEAARMGDVPSVMRVLEFMERCGLQPDSKTNTVIVKALMASGDLEGGIRVMEEMRASENERAWPDVFTYGVALKESVRDQETIRKLKEWMSEDAISLEDAGAGSFHFCSSQKPKRIP